MVFTFIKVPCCLPVKLDERIERIDGTELCHLGRIRWVGQRGGVQRKLQELAFRQLGPVAGRIGTFRCPEQHVKCVRGM